MPAMRSREHIARFTTNPPEMQVDLWKHVKRLNRGQRTVMVALKRLPDLCCSAAFTMLNPVHILCHFSVLTEDISLLKVYDGVSSFFLLKKKHTMLKSDDNAMEIYADLVPL